MLWPLKTKPGIASSFCEYRSNHFHGGIDCKTWGARSVACLAVDDGRISRVKMQGGGYGRALYLETRDGRTAVYAHLDHFVPSIDQMVRKEQEARGEYEVDLYYSPDSSLYFKRGDIIAYSGVSGTVAPHLHFEYRNSAQFPLNPFKEGFAVSDHKAPVPVSLALIPLDGNSTVEGDCQPRLYTRLLRRPDGKFEPGDPIGVIGRIGVSLDEYDQVDSSTNEVAAYKIEMQVNGETYWTTEFDSFSYSETRCIEVERDYRLARRGKGVYHRLYRVHGNKLKMLTGDGIIDAGTADKFPIDVRIILSDAEGNCSNLFFKLVSDTADADTERDIGGRPLIHTNGWSKGERDYVSEDIFDGFIRLAGPPGVAGFRINCQKSEYLPAKQVEGGVSAVWVPALRFSGLASVTAENRQGRKVGDRDIRLFWASPDTSNIIRSEDGNFEVEIPPGALYDNVFLQIFPENYFKVAACR
jgi:hypothetical protein